MKKVLLAVCGLSPQVITETLYALFDEGRMVHAVHVITTRSGKEEILSTLLAPQDGKFQALLADRGLPPAEIEFSPGNIHALRSQSGLEIDDILSPADNEILIQTCLDLAFRFTSEPDTAVYFLVAGGRKTMTSCLTLAAQLYGRPQDRIFHVLVSPEFENCREFWFPPKQSTIVELKDAIGQPYWKETRCARVQLITIPFVSVREQLALEMLDRPRTPAELMQSLIRDMPRNLLVNLAEGKLVFGRAELDLHPAWLALYAFFAERKKSCRLVQSCNGCNDCFLEASAVIADPGIGKLYERITGNCRFREMSDSGIGSLNIENFNSYKSKIKQAILRSFGQTGAAELEIAAVGKRPDTRYGIPLDRNRIRVEW